MNATVRIALFVLLLVAIVGYCLPWFTWTCRTSLRFSESFKQGLAGLPDDLMPHENSEFHVVVAPMQRGFSPSEAGEGTDENVMALFSDFLPALRFGPRTTQLGGVGFALSWLFLIAAIISVVSWRPRLTLVMLSLAVGTLVVALADEQHLGRYLSYARVEEQAELPAQFQMSFNMDYHTTPWFWLSTGSTAVAIITLLVSRLKSRVNDY